MDLDPNTIKALIGLAGVLGGAIIGGSVAAYNARQKLREIEVSHSHELHANYLKNAREYLGSIYVPLSIELAKLSQEYLNYRKAVAIGGPAHKSKRIFFEAALKYVTFYNDLLNRGASAFLTTELQNKSLEFGSFLGGSLEATETIRRVVIGYGISMLGVYVYANKDLKISGKSAKFWSGKFGFSQLGVTVRFDGNLVLAAPLASPEFEEYFSYYTTILNLLVKEVTLGVKPEPST